MWLTVYLRFIFGIVCAAGCISNTPVIVQPQALPLPVRSVPSSPTIDCYTFGDRNVHGRLVDRACPASRDLNPVPLNRGAARSEPLILTRVNNYTHKLITNAFVSRNNQASSLSAD